MYFFFYIPVHGRATTSLRWHPCSQRTSLLPAGCVGAPRTSPAHPYPRRLPTTTRYVPRNSTRDSMKSPQHTPPAVLASRSRSPPRLLLEAKKVSCEGSWIVYMFRCRKTCVLFEDLFCQGSSSSSPSLFSWHSTLVTKGTRQLFLEPPNPRVSEDDTERQQRHLGLSVLPNSRPRYNRPISPLPHPSEGSSSLCLFLNPTARATQGHLHVLCYYHTRPTSLSC
ncbi:hypothetical protein GE09DRAFT_425220 [Coniochaeta sp. 2T2.1]|nr:hypothetical protein GE09DRAFT_425220 [Coniochaeta sp. 2T2.1]